MQKDIDLNLDLSPQSKKAMGKNQVEIQELIISQMKSNGQGKIKGEIAVDITVYTAVMTPPRIEKYIKNLLDLLHKENLLSNSADFEYLPFEDDKDIRYLSVRYVFIVGREETAVRVREFSSFLGDLHVVVDQLNKRDAKNDEYDQARDAYEDILSIKDSISEEAYEAMFDLNLLNRQKSLADLTAITPLSVSLIYPEKNNPVKFLKDTYRDWANMLIGNSISIHLPGVPTERGGSTAYKELVLNQFKKYVDRNSIFSALKAPVIVCVFYVPPDDKEGFFKDLDNIMLDYIMPSFNSVFCPPLTPHNLHMDPNIEFLESVPKSLNGSAIGYEIIELPSSFTGISRGSVNVGFKLVQAHEQGMLFSVEEILKKNASTHFID